MDAMAHHLPRSYRFCCVSMGLGWPIGCSCAFRPCSTLPKQYLEESVDLIYPCALRGNSLGSRLQVSWDISFRISRRPCSGSGSRVAEGDLLASGQRLLCQDLCHDGAGVHEGDGTRLGDAIEILLVQCKANFGTSADDGVHVLLLDIHHVADYSTCGPHTLVRTAKVFWNSETLNLVNLLVHEQLLGSLNIAMLRDNDRIPSCVHIRRDNYGAALADFLDLRGINVLDVSAAFKDSCAVEQKAIVVNLTFTTPCTVGPVGRNHPKPAPVQTLRSLLNGGSGHMHHSEAGENCHAPAQAVRGIQVLIPGVAGTTENVDVFPGQELVQTGRVGLHHSEVPYCFRAGHGMLGLGEQLQAHAAKAAASLVG